MWKNKFAIHLVLLLLTTFYAYFFYVKELQPVSTNSTDFIYEKKKKKS